MISSRPNILYLNTHDTGRCVSPMGWPVHTPHLQAMASEGVLFRDCHNAGPTCSPSRAGLLTGMWAHCSGMLGLAHLGFSLIDNRWHLAHHLADHGYETAAWGMATNHCAREVGDCPADAAAMGYHTWLGDTASLAPALDWLRAPRPRPFFLSLSWVRTHRIGRGFSGVPDHERYDPRWLQPPPVLPDDRITREDWSWFASDCTAWDAELGRVLAALRDAGLADNTLVIVTTDHGIPFPGHKCTLTHHGTGVFLVMRGPGGFSGGQVVDHLVSHIDLFPTLCAVAGLPKPERLQGVDLRPTLGADGRAVRGELFSEVTWHAAYEPMRCIRTGRWNYIRRFGSRRAPVVPNCDQSTSQDVLRAAGGEDRPHASEQLHDLVLDPQERHNLVGDQRCEHIRTDLAARLERWMRETDDPLLTNQDLPLPPGCWAVHPDAPAPDGSPRLSGSQR